MGLIQARGGGGVSGVGPGPEADGGLQAQGVIHLAGRDGRIEVVGDRDG